MTGPGSSSSSAPANNNAELDRVKLEVEIWGKIVDAQQHFNDLGLRIRSMAIPVLVGAIGFAGYVVKEQANYFFALVIIVAGIVGWGAFFMMDRYWYHNLLRAAATHAGQVEERLLPLLPSIGLSSAITRDSRTATVPRWLFFGAEITFDSRRRLERFYRLGFWLLVLVGVVLMVSRALNRPPQPTPRTPSAIHG
jgi:hypothetical protein